MKSSSIEDFILIVDDNTDNLAVLSKTLIGAGYATRVAIDGESALEQVADDHPALILLDVMMPGIDGFETCRRLKENPETLSIPVIFMTALSQSESKVKGLSLGAVDYITKPFNEAEVLARVRIHLKIQNLMRTLELQNQRLKVEIEQRQQTAATLQQLNDELEVRVTARTADLEKAQVTLVQQEKLSTLGELVAGVAHEINNPMGCIIGNIEFMQDYSEQLLAHIDHYQQLGSSPEITSHAKDIDLDFIRQDFPNLLRSVQDSSHRIQAISDSLRTFARGDTPHKDPFDLHSGLDSTLLILKHRLKAQDNRAEITIHRQYGDLPEVPCFPGQMNQVFMNILANAIDAFDECCPEKPTLHLRTWQKNAPSNQIVIEIADNATGMPEVVRSQIFERAYTTKAVGKGTGLGLSIVRQIIVDTHGGTIDCASTPGVGTRFTITLPLKPD